MTCYSKDHAGDGEDPDEDEEEEEEDNPRGGGAPGKGARRHPLEPTFERDASLPPPGPPTSAITSPTSSIPPRTPRDEMAPAPAYPYQTGGSTGKVQVVRRAAPATDYRTLHAM